MTRAHAAAALLLAAAAASAEEPAAPRPRPTVELGGELSAVASEGLGALDAYELPRVSLRPARERTFSLSVRQSRLHAEAALPSGGLLAGAALRARLELDFAGGSAPAASATGAGAAFPQPQPRLREAWAEARLDGPSHLTLLAGQAPGLFAGPRLAESVGHRAVARFSGAGDLSRRAPQLRAGAAWGGPLELEAAAAILAPQDPHVSEVPSSTNPTPAGVRSGVPDVEGRAAVAWRGADGLVASLGLSGHAGRQTYRLDGLVGQPDGALDGWGGALDLVLEHHGLALVGAAWAGRNLGALGTGADGATLWTDATTGRLLAVTGVPARGGWAQLQWRVLPELTLLAGGGQEAASRSGLPSGDYRWKSGQLSGGLIAELGGGWRAGLEATSFQARSTAGAGSRTSSTQLELGLLAAF